MLLRFFILVFVVAALSKIWFIFSRGQLRRGPLFSWTIIWLAVAVVALVPDLSSRLARLVGVGRGADLVVYGSVLVLFYLVFRLIIKQSYLEQEIADMVKHIALRQADKNYDQDRR